MGEASHVYSISLNTMTDALFCPRLRSLRGASCFYMALESRDTVHLMNLSDSTLADQRHRKFSNQLTMTPVARQ